MSVKCSAITKSGSRCSRPALANKHHCLMHDPESTELRREASRKGGRNRSAQARAQKLLPEVLAPEDLAAWLSNVFKTVMLGKTEPKIGTACATIAKAILEAQQAANQPAIEDLQEQVELLRLMVQRGQAA